MEWPEELLELFEDPILADVKPRATGLTASDRLVKTLQEITAWVEKNGHLPTKAGDFNEKRMYRSLEALKKNADELQAYDTLHILE